MEARARHEHTVVHAQGVAAAGQGLESGHPHSREFSIPLTCRQRSYWLLIHSAIPSTSLPAGLVGVLSRSIILVHACDSYGEACIKGWLGRERGRGPSARRHVNSDWSEARADGHER